MMVRNEEMFAFSRQRSSFVGDIQCEHKVGNKIHNNVMRCFLRKSLGQVDFTWKNAIL
jgi:hypothetical protein